MCREQEISQCVSEQEAAWGSSQPSPGLWRPSLQAMLWEEGYLTDTALIPMPKGQGKLGLRGVGQVVGWLCIMHRAALRNMGKR